MRKQIFILVLIAFLWSLVAEARPVFRQRGQRAVPAAAFQRGPIKRPLPNRLRPAFRRYRLGKIFRRPHRRPHRHHRRHVRHHRIRRHPHRHWYHVHHHVRRAAHPAPTGHRIVRPALPKMPARPQPPIRPLSGPRGHAAVFGPRG